MRGRDLSDRERTDSDAIAVEHDDRPDLKIVCDRVEVRVNQVSECLGAASVVAPE